ncbi:hypothetical protein DEV91_124113 [Phyllobacterium brassicacearum]|nr:hypothetical protein DEV91_124113 [Phyllobacterium brassicacearum]
MNTSIDPMTFSDLGLQVVAAIALILICEFAKRRFSK